MICIPKEQSNFGSPDTKGSLKYVRAIGSSIIFGNLSMPYQLYYKQYIYVKIVNIMQLLPALKVNIIIVHPRKNNIPRVNNYDVHRKCKQ